MPTVRRQNIKREQQEMAETNGRGAPLRIGGETHTSEPVYHEKSLRWTKDEEFTNKTKEQPQIAAAVSLLQFLPTANLSLLVYLFGFCTQLPLCPNNGIQPDDITRIFGHPMMGGETKSDAMKLMLWFLHRWPKISEGLLAQCTTACEEELKNPIQSVGDFPVTSSDSLLEALDDYSRILTSRYTELVVQDEPRKGLYQFAEKGFPASYDLYALSQVVTDENHLQSVDSRIHQSASITAVNGTYFPILLPLAS
jgi:hypothetical protein